MRNSSVNRGDFQVRPLLPYFIIFFGSIRYEVIPPTNRQHRVGLTGMLRRQVSGMLQRRSPLLLLRDGIIIMDSRVRRRYGDTCGKHPMGMAKPGVFLPEEVVAKWPNYHARCLYGQGLSVPL